MQQFNYPTTIFFGEGAIERLASVIGKRGNKHLLLVTDATLVGLGVAEDVAGTLRGSGAQVTVFDHVHPNPIEDDVQLGTAAYKKNGCDAIVALGGGSPIDVAKVIKFLSTHDGPLAQYEDRLGGDALIVNPMPPVYAIPTTAGTGSEVGRSSVVTLAATQKKTIFFAPQLMPDIAVLAPELTVGLPAHITAATGIDAFTHCLEAWLAPGFHPMADGIAQEGIKICLDCLPRCVEDGTDLDARGKMLMAATMGATAFQKGLGMIHSLAHPLSAHFGLHHGLTNALLLPASIEFLEKSDLSDEQRARLAEIQRLFQICGLAGDSLSASCRQWFEKLGIVFGLAQHGIPEGRLDFLAEEAFDDPCHGSNMIPVSRDDLLATYRAAL
ncbi:MAG: iron-containing alcohol dehydrogenase [Verrucomicrobiae bacterium]|nr:iron-containing alcohol dehydrogenase [Verrucomicrobiae bacterium]